MIKSGWAAIRLSLLLSLVLAAWGGAAHAQITPTVHQAATQVIDVPAHNTAGVTQIIDNAGNVIGTAANPMYTTASGGGSGGTSSNFAAAFPTAGTAVGAKNGANMVNLTADGSNNLNVNVAASGLGLALDASVGTTNTDVGPPGATACATDTGSCSLNALMQRIAQRLTTVNTTLGTPMQATGGTVGLVAGSQLVGKVGFDQTTPGTTNAVALAQIGSTTVVTGGVAGSLAIGGPTASGASFTANPLPSGGRAQNAEATAVTNGQAVAAAYDLVGKAITSPWANKENWISGTASGTDTAAHSIIASAGGSLKNYIRTAQCYRTDTGTTAIVLTFSDANSSVMILPAAGANFAGSGAIASFEPPIATAAATAFSFTSGTGTTTVYCDAQGFKGT